MDNQAAIVDVLVEFMEAVIHQILYVREIYPLELFERQRLYGVAVRKARHPELVEYIHTVVTSLKEPLTIGSLSKVAIVIIGPDHQPVERHILEPRLLLNNPTNQQNTSNFDENAGNRKTAQSQLMAIEGQLRAFILKLQYMDSYLDKAPPNSTFEVAAYTIGRMGINLSDWIEEQPPIPSFAQQQQQRLFNSNLGGQNTSIELVDGEIVPVKSCRLEGAFQLQLYTEREAS